MRGLVVVGFMKRTLWITDELLQLSTEVRIKLLEPLERPEFISRLNSWNAAKFWIRKFMPGLPCLSVTSPFAEWHITESSMPRATRLGEWRKLQESRSKCRIAQKHDMTSALPRRAETRGLTRPSVWLFPIVWGTLRYWTWPLRGSCWLLS